MEKIMELVLQKDSPSADQWLKEAKQASGAPQEGMFLLHNGVVRRTPKAQVRAGVEDGGPVREMDFSFDAAGVREAIRETGAMEGIWCVKVWLNQGRLQVGDDIMYVLIGGDIRPRVIDALQFLVEWIKTRCVTETEIR